MDKLNVRANEVIDKYLNLKLFGKNIKTPYYINHIDLMYRKLMKDKGVSVEVITKVKEGYKNKEVNYGWYRGKGTPEEIEESTMKLSENLQINLNGASEEGILDFIKLYGLGVDCSGFVYNVFSYTFSEADINLDNILNFPDSRKVGVNYAGTSVFYNSSKLVSIKDIQPLDMVFINKQDHVGVVTQIKDKFYLSHSSISASPSGVAQFEIFPKELNPFKLVSVQIGKEWGELLSEGLIEIRRLRL